MKYILAAVLLITPAAGFALEPIDSVTGMCLDADAEYTDALCYCATSALLAEVGEEDFATYEQVGAIYLENLADDMGMVDAWMAGIDEVGASLSVTNSVGNAHRLAIDSCK